MGATTICYFNQEDRFLEKSMNLVDDYYWVVNHNTDGKIELENLQLRYTPTLPMVLKGITCTLPGEKKIRVVGGLGSGKSTLTQALFRVVEPCGGQILIDAVHICRIGVQDLRFKLAIILQDPTLFHGIVRTNLDTLQEHIDEEMWEEKN
ncbi:hypothetical protein SLEP1_g25518 [Rubroshorea leprosula]|uniref:ABC transporter domain-containing protein n=1 Tax=Rubroshorea leprosula TaxID=152421 RepID=A0AAV5JQG3_9ROSI|nr:hypothetical protein SLEP1_g25518 [Rubroshorea leprosula]